MKIVLGLGNPGARYASTRHNIGFAVADALAGRRGVSFRRRDDLSDLALVAESSFGDEPTLLAKPRTYMNRSGRAAYALCRSLDVPFEQLCVVHDDADLELGRIRIRRGGSAGGHNGLRSLIAALGTEEFPRVKLGVRGASREHADLADYVLETFDPAERATVDALVGLGADAVEVILGQGLLSAMNLYNGRSV